MKNKKGFTIVELVIVIAVIAILAAVLIPTFTSVTRNAKISAAQSQAKNGLDQILALTGGVMPEGTLFVVDDDDDVQGDYAFAYIKNKLTQVDMSKQGKASNGSDTFPKTTGTNEYTVYICAEAFDNDAAEADRTAALEAAKGMIKAAIGFDEGDSWIATGSPATGSAYAEWTYGTPAVADPETAAVVKGTVKVYYTADINSTLVVFIAG